MQSQLIFPSRAMKDDMSDILLGKDINFSLKSEDRNMADQETKYWQKD